MNPWLLSAAAMLVCAAPVAAVLVRGHLMSALIAYEMVSSVAVMELVLVGEGFDRSGEFELPVLLALLLFGSGLVFVRALERWL